MIDDFRLLIGMGNLQLSSSIVNNQSSIINLKSSIVNQHV